MRHPAGKQASNPVFLCIAELLAHYGRLASGRKAILAPSCPPITYGELLALAMNTISLLRSCGVTRTNRVAVVLPNGPDAAAAFLSIAASAVCVPLNPAFTADEWRRYFSELRISALLTRPDMDSASREVAIALNIPVIDLPPVSRGRSMWRVAASTRPPAWDGDFASGADDAFMLLTSGSSSRPKIVPLTQAAVCRSAHNVGATLALAHQDRLLNVLPLFHVHGLVSGLLAALAAGSSVVCTPGFDATGFFEWLEEFRPSWYTAVPTIHRAVLSAAGRHSGQTTWPRSLRIIRSASSILPPDLAHELEALFGIAVIDTFGMTEAASQIAANPPSRRKAGSVGRSAGAEIAIMDSRGRRLPAGKRGEITLRGPTLTRGYDNDPAATAAAFRKGWFRTGDLGYLDRDGYLFVVGRIKDIINRGGQKIAPAEVEEALLSHPDIAEATAFAIAHDRLGEDVAAAVVLRPNAQLSVDELLTYMRQRLAAFKVPGQISIISEIPKGPTGKIKRGELVAALSRRRQAQTHGRPSLARSGLELQLANVWSELLGLDHIGIDEDVFGLGADSITMMQMRSRLKSRFGFDLSLKDMFVSRTVAALAAHLASSKSNTTAQPQIVPLNWEGPRPVSIVQEEVLQIERELSELPCFNRSLGYRLQGALNIHALELSLAEVVRRHESLRTQFTWQDGRPAALVVPTLDLHAFLLVEDLADGRSTSTDQAKSLLLKKAGLKAEQLALTTFDVNRAPLFQARLLRLGPNDHVFLIVLHDIIVDGWSMEVFMDEISELYATYVDGRSADLGAPRLQFCDFADWHRRWSAGANGIRQFAFWKRRLRGFKPVFSADKGVRADLLAVPIIEEAVHIPSELLGSLRTLAYKRGATLFMILLAAFKALLLVRTGRNDICVATPMANRSQVDMERVIGPVANTTLVRTQLKPDLTFEEALGLVRDSVLEAHARQEFPFDILAARLAAEDGIDPTSLVQVCFVLQNTFNGPLELAGTEVRPFAPQQEPWLVPVDCSRLSISLRETLWGISGTCRARNNKSIEQRASQYWAANYKEILRKAAANPDASLATLNN
ncbi:MAG: AMP-binding protein [Candidatus Sulfotelmatobacter sp.]